MKKMALWLSALLAAIMVVGTACGGGGAPTPKPAATPTPKVASTPRPATTPTRAVTTPAAAPTAVAPTGPALEISTPKTDEFKFDKPSLSGKAGTQVTVRFRNSSLALEHNWVLVTAGTKDAVAAAGASAGPVNNWVAKGPNVLANTKVTKSGETAEVTFTVPAAGTYQFVCTFPGHAVTMFGEFKSTP